MAKSRDYIYMDVINIAGKKIGYIKDILIDFNKGMVVGFKINPYKLLGKDFNVPKENIIYHKSQLIINNITRDRQLEFSTIINMHVVDKHSNILGLVNEIIFCEESFEIKGLAVRDYNILGMFKNRLIFLKKDLIIGEEYVFYNGENSNIKLECISSVESRKNNDKDVYYEKV
ncbi:MAG: PRC-barrel domain-containing protein [Clostridium sp.]|uniref:PRC-barrel domain-containing protein n=1 Tax=Clostridium sp. TaxID=1506 RepID=UPI0030464D48